MEDYTKPLDCETYSVLFTDGKFENKMKLRRVPLQGEHFETQEKGIFKITKVIYLPWNKFKEDIRIEGESC